jgi:PAS domain S-box-containing protein
MEDAHRFVVVFEEPRHREEAESLLQSRFQGSDVEPIETRAQWMERLDGDPPCLLLASAELSWENGFSFLASAKRQWTDCPVLFCDERNGRLCAAVAMLGEHQDFLLDVSLDESELPEAAEAALRRSEQRKELREAQMRYRRLFERVPVGLYRTDLSGGIIDVNPALTEMLGFDSAEQIASQNVMDFFVDAKNREKQVETLERDGVVKAMELRLKKRDGEAIWVRDSARAIRETGGDTYFEGAMEDITQEKEAERQLQKLNEELSQERQRLAGVVENFPEGVLVLDRDRRVLMANPLARDYLQLLAKRNSLGAVTGLGDRSLEDLLEPMVSSRLQEITISHPRERVFQVMPRQVEGTLHGGGWILVLREVTAEREAQRRAQLQDRLASVGQLAAGIAHDFGNVITVISSYARELMEKKGGVTEANRLELIVEEARKAASLVQQIQDFTKRSSEELEPTDLVLVLGQARAFLRRTIPENIKLEMEIDCDECVVLGDLAAIQQMLATLALNAKDAMPKGGVFRVRLRRGLVGGDRAAPLPGMKPGQWAFLEVSDTGSRPPDQFLPRIFDSFFGDRDSGRGVGLALAQVYGIVRRHDGQMSVSHEKGLGTTMEIYLPVSGSFKRDATPMEPTGLPRGSGEKILIVDDEPSVVRSTVSALELLQYEPLAASSGKEALDIYRKNRKDLSLVMADVIMPDMSGTELLEAIHQDDPGFKVVLVTGYAGEVERKKLDPELAGWLEKPWTLPELARAVRKALD